MLYVRYHAHTSFKFGNTISSLCKRSCEGQFMQSTETIKADRYAAFRYRSFSLFWVSRFLNSFAVQILSVSVAWQVYDMTGDPFYLGLVGMLQFLPSLLLVLVTGAVSDRHSRRLIMAVCDSLEALCAAALLLFTMSGSVSVMPVFVILVVMGTARAFYGPAASSLAANLVPAQAFANAVSWNSSAWQIASIVGPVAGGLLYGLSATLAYSTATIFLIISAITILAIPKPAQHISTHGDALEKLLGGFRYIYSEKIVLGAISLDLFAVLLGGAVALLPVYARDILVLGPWGLGMLRAAPGIGAVAVAFWLAGHPIRNHAGYILLIAVALFGLFTAIFGVSTTPWLSIIALALLGAVDGISVYIREVLIQLWTPDALRGRVNAVNMVFVGASNELGEFRAGMMASGFGAVPSVLFGGIASVAVAIGWAVMFPQLRNARSLEGRV
jgi:MFS family permease